MKQQIRNAVYPKIAPRKNCRRPVHAGASGRPRKQAKSHHD